MEDLLKSFGKVVANFCTPYRGCNIVKMEDGKFHVLRGSFETIEDAKKAIDAAFKNLKK